MGGLKNVLLKTKLLFSYKLYRKLLYSLRTFLVYWSFKNLVKICHFLGYSYRSLSLCLSVSFSLSLYIYISSSSSCHAGSTDIPDPLSPLFPIVHRLRKVSSHSCWMYVRAGCPAFARPCVGVHKSTSLMSSSLLLQQCPACLVHLTWIVFMIGGRWPYSWCLVGCCRQDLFKIARSILV